MQYETNIMRIATEYYENHLIIAFILGGISVLLHCRLKENMSLALLYNPMHI
jgi:hypothetical protein